MFLATEATGSVTIMDMVTQVKDTVFTNVSFADVIGVVVALIGATIVINFAWTYGRKAFKAIVNALKGRSSKVM